jgi:glyoxylase-like metal-dependent hydrolase (beta-lactamase superfamily II)
MELHNINAGLFKLDGGAMFGVVPKSLWHKLNPADDNNMCTWTMRCLLIIDGAQRILIDTGMGDKQDAKFFGHYYMHGTDTLYTSLANVGLTPADITDVVLTHLHFDHCGGCIQYNNSKDGFEPVFKNAKYWTNEAHWNNAIKPNPREKASFLTDNILPIQQSGHLNFVTDATVINPNLSFIHVNGHTEQMMLPVLQHKEREIIYCADLFASIHHLPTPWVMAYDMQPLLTMQEKQQVLQRAVNNNSILFFEHDAYHNACTVQSTEKGIKPQQILQLNNNTFEAIN